MTSLNTEENRRFKPGDALLVVDVQNDFCPGGALAVPEGDQVVSVLNLWMEEARRRGVPVLASRDWHPPNHISFRERGGPWPAHCIRNTPGARFHSDLILPEGTIVISKATQSEKEAYSAFDSTGLATLLEESNVRRLWIGGLTTDYCVQLTALDAAEKGLQVRVILAGCRAVDIPKGRAAQALERMDRTAGVEFEREERP